MDKQLQNRRIIRAVKSRELIFNKNHPDHRNRLKVNKNWEEIAEIVNLPIDEVKKKWRNLRDTMMIAIRGKTTKISSWPLYDEMQFIKPHVTSRRPSGNIFVQQQAPIVKTTVVKTTTTTPQFIQQQTFQPQQQQQQPQQHQIILQSPQSQQIKYETSQSQTIKAPPHILDNVIITKPPPLKRIQQAISTEQEYGVQLQEYDRNSNLPNLPPNPSLEIRLIQPDGTTNCGTLSTQKFHLISPQQVQQATNVHHRPSSAQIFFDSLAARFEKLNSYQQSQLQIQILKLFHEAEFSNQGSAMFKIVELK